MHISSLENMDRALAYYGSKITGKIVDLGSMDVNGSYRHILGDQADYIGVDLESGPGVDVVLDDPYQLPFAGNSIDMVISGQMLEHCAFFWKTFEEIARVLKPEGLCIMIAPSAGRAHYKVDYYRFYADAWKAMSELTGLRIVDQWIDPRGQWRDNVCVFQKGVTAPTASRPIPRAPAFQSVARKSEACACQQSPNSVTTDKFMTDLLNQLAPAQYVQIGGGLGNLSLPGRVVCISADGVNGPTGSETHCIHATSDDFFHFGAMDLLEGPIDVAYIRGRRLFDDVYRDFLNLEPRMSPTGRILIDNVRPCCDMAGYRGATPGDVWHFMEIITKQRPMLHLDLSETAPYGLLSVGKLKANSVLMDLYNPLVMSTLKKSARNPE